MKTGRATNVRHEFMGINYSSRSEKKAKAENVIILRCNVGKFVDPSSSTIAYVQLHKNSNYIFSSCLLSTPEWKRTQRNDTTRYAVFYLILCFIDVDVVVVIVAAGAVELLVRSYYSIYYSAAIIFFACNVYSCVDEGKIFLLLVASVSAHSLTFLFS